MKNPFQFVKILFSSLSMTFLLGSIVLFSWDEPGLALGLLAGFGLFLTMTTIIFLVEPPRPSRFIRLTKFELIRLD